MKHEYEVTWGWGGVLFQGSLLHWTFSVGMGTQIFRIERKDAVFKTRCRLQYRVRCTCRWAEHMTKPALCQSIPWGSLCAAWLALTRQWLAALQQLQARCSASSSLAAERMNLMEQKARSVLCLGPKNLNIYIAGAIAMSKWSQPFFSGSFKFSFGLQNE